MKSIVQHLREEKKLTQSELAEKTGLSLRTIQRIEAGNTPKGFTLQTLASVFEIAPEKLQASEEGTNVNRAKLINLSILCGILFPYGGVIVPLFLTYKTENTKNRDLGKSMVSIQILLTMALSVSLIASPFLQKGLTVRFPIFLIPLIATIVLQLAVVILNGISLNQKQDLPKKLKVNFL
ncbi:uncharacterized protein DUF4870 [Flavobacterium chryseum]|uniref:helix-turn-helix domain-containing protein n=1 Tax=Flavobacterium sp. P3160 TaxID=2512113 RepID=UPI00105C632E|nr:helix-turn-helix domain-containing protein [Flavobacterium sp. P3160]TDO73412.1 uncharacterized protein DUF4870 [Flavobacterium sp. P3160]